MSVVAVDLAAKYSAFVHLDTNGRVIAQADSVSGEGAFLNRTMDTVQYDFAGQLVVEDLPHGVDYRNLVKRVCQIQGRFVERMYRLDRLDELLFVAPNTWRAHYPELRKRGVGMEAVIPVAAELGYIPPELVGLYGPKGGKALATKVQTDYCAAYLIAVWANHTFAEQHTYDVPGTSRYGQSAITKDAHA